MGKLPEIWRYWRDAWRISRLEFWWNNPAMMLDTTILGTYWVTTDCRGEFVEAK
jgi:hypothetical protein